MAKNINQKILALSKVNTKMKSIYILNNTQIAHLQKAQEQIKRGEFITNEDLNKKINILLS